MAKIIIEEFMTDKLKLGGNALVLFAILWKESKQGKEIATDDYAQYTKTMNCTNATYYNTKEKLIKAGVIKEHENGLKVVYKNT